MAMGERLRVEIVHHGKHSRVEIDEILYAELNDYLQPVCKPNGSQSGCLRSQVRMCYLGNCFPSTVQASRFHTLFRSMKLP